MEENEVIYVEIFGNHKEFDYTKYGEHGIMIFARKRPDGIVTGDVKDIVEKTQLKEAPLIDTSTIPTV